VPTYVILPRAKKLLPTLKKLADQAETVYLATDFDREGESIAWHLVNVLKLDEKKVKRITFHEITPEAIKTALSQPRKIELNLVNSQQSRRIIDRLVGYKLSPLLWQKIANKLSAGRVQSVALKIIYDREIEIEKFVPQEYWTIDAEFYKLDILNKTIKSRLKYIDNKKIDKLHIKTSNEAEKIVNEIKSINFGTIIELKTELKQKQPLPPFVTSTLQQEASRKLHFSPSKTMMIAQSLYEGIELGSKEPIGLITYMRTDSVFISQSAIEEVRKYINEKFSQKYLPQQPKKFKNKIKNAQEAHEAIRPTSCYREPQQIKSYLTEDQYKLYKLIWERFVSSQMKEMEYEHTILKIAVGDKYTFESEGKKIVFDGYSILYKEDTSEEEISILPEITKNEKLNLKDCNAKQNFTEPPPRYNEASLIKELEKNGIGRPSTYATIVDTLKLRGYVVLKDRRFFITPIGRQVTELLSKYFPEIVAKNYTARIEKLLDEISEGKENWVEVIKKFYEPLKKDLATALTEIKSKKVEKTDIKCDLCGGKMVIRNGRYGKFLSCENFPKCKFKKNYEQPKTTSNTKS
jgi:DNA topoisomerase-1